MMNVSVSASLESNLTFVGGPSTAVSVPCSASEIVPTSPTSCALSVPLAPLNEYVVANDSATFTRRDHDVGNGSAKAPLAVAWLVTGPVMLPSFVEKLTYGGAVAVLFGLGRTGGMMLVSGLVDLIWGALFLIVYARTPPGP